MKKLFILLFSFSLFFLFSRSEILAQTFSCQWNGSSASCIPTGSCPSDSPINPSSFCNQYSSLGLSATCGAQQNISCGTPPGFFTGPGGDPIHGNCGASGIDTAIGCVPFGDQNALVGFILRWALGIGGGIAFLLILVAGFQIMTSRGDPNRLKAGQELMTSAIAGLLLMIFSIFILRLIGVDILNIPGFAK